jgi:hypothetical protein
MILHTKVVCKYHAISFVADFFPIHKCIYFCIGVNDGSYSYVIKELIVRLS